MARNKPRLQLALYARPKHPGTYHYALFVAPKAGRGPFVKHHAKNTLVVDKTGQASQPWRYERTVVADANDEARLLVRIVLAKVIGPEEQVHQIFDSVPVDEPTLDFFSCRTWVGDAYERLRAAHAVAPGAQDWEVVHGKALEYVERKQRAGRWDGAGRPGGGVEVPLLDLLQEREVVE